MRARASQITGAMALAICVLCPLIDLFDQWDRAFQTGHDTEYPLVVLALCVGAAFALGRLILTLSRKPLVTSIRFALQSALHAPRCVVLAATMVPAPESPPLRLRI
ncbi:MAG TPA: hypothetical protein VNI36_08535 [Candidatus Dormibacteraeota bacterium]|nr:hypothetical protein [Candidatus Dormibacteraeota bacterium]